MPPQCDLPQLSRLSAALKSARAEAVGLFSVAFPPLPAEAFENLVRASEAQTIFLFENRKKEIAEATLNFSGKCKILKNARLKTLAEFFPGNRRNFFVNETDAGKVPAPKIFFAGTFDEKSENFAAFPMWQISKIGNETKICAHIFPEENEVSAEEILRDFSRLKCLAQTPPAPRDTENLPRISAGTELGGNYFAAAEKAISEIRAGNFRKIVLARACDFSLSDFSEKTAGTLIDALRKRFIENECTVFLARTSAKNAEEKILGATPEMLVRLANGKLETEAIAGTAKNDGSAQVAENLLCDEKELREHRFVVDFIAEKLRECGLSPHFSQTPEVLRLPNVFHLRTKISANVPARISLGKIASALHPTPAMCGIPADAAAKFIRENEEFPRENFSAPVGFYDADGNGFFAVAIRCAKISNDGNARFYAGSGLVAESVPEKEFAEIDAKFSAIFSVFKK